MVLENFIVDAPIVWDRVGKKIFENPHVKQGRKMRVQITNAGMVEDLSGYTLALGWRHTVSGVEGLDVFEDSSEANVGIFEMAYTENLMTNLGNLKASLVLTSVEDMVVAESNDFYVKVDDSPFGADAEQGVGSYTRLAQILLNEEVRQEAYLTNEARISAIETGIKHEVTNIIESNSDFSSTSGLSLFGATVAASENVLTITGNGTSSLPNAGFNIANLPTGSKIYMRVWARVLNSECSKITLRSESTEIASRANPVSGQWYEVSGIRIKSGSLETALNMAMTHTYSGSAAANGKQMEVKWAVAINLTDDFGAGTEPTADYTGMMLRVFPDKYFTGTKFVYPLQVLANDMTDAYQVIDDKFDAFVQTNIVQEEVAEVFNNLEETYAQDLVSVKNGLEQTKVSTTYFSPSKTPFFGFVDDDGVAEVYSRLYPIFNARSVPANCAIITGSIGDVGYMTEANLDVLKASGWEFLGHGNTYLNNLSEFPVDADLEYQLGEGCKRWLEDRGHKVNGFVYPQNSSDLRIRRFTKKYYDFAFGNLGLNTGDFIDTMRIKRIAFGSFTDSNPTVNGNGDKNTLNYYKACVDYAITNNIWLVFMSHVGAQTLEQDAILGQLLDYIIAQNGKIVTASDGYKTFGNKVFVGDVETDYVAINENGIFSSEFTNYPHTILTQNTKLLTDSISSFPFGVSVIPIDYNYGNANGFPESGSGTWVTYRVKNEYEYVYNRQEFWKGASNRRYVRYPKSDGTWSAFDEILTRTALDASLTYLIKPLNHKTEADLITAYENGKITTFAVNGVNAFNSMSGLVTTYRINGNGWDKQELRRYNTNEVYSRFPDTATGAWTAWAKISAV